MGNRTRTVAIIPRYSCLIIFQGLSWAEFGSLKRDHARGTAACKWMAKILSFRVWRLIKRFEYISKSALPFFNFVMYGNLGMSRAEQWNRSNDSPTARPHINTVRNRAVANNFHKSQSNRLVNIASRMSSSGS